MEKDPIKTLLFEVFGNGTAKGNGFLLGDSTLPETNMETHKGPHEEPKP